MTRLTLVALSLVLVVPTGADAAPGRWELLQLAAKYRWSAAGGRELNAMFANASTVKEFLNTLASEGNDRIPDCFSAVKNYRIADLRGDGSLEVVAIVDENGRGFFTAIEIVSREQDVGAGAASVVKRFGGFVVRQVNGFHIDNLDAVLKDLDGDGAVEMIVPDSIEAYQGGAGPIAVVPDIYEWNGRGYEKRNAKYSWYYREVVVPDLLREADDVGAASQTSPHSSERSLAARRRGAIDRAIAEARRRAQQR